MEGCLEETAVIAFLGGTLRPDERAIVEKHIAACSACADLVTWTAADQASGTVRLPGHEGRPFVGQLHPGARVGRYQILGAVGRGGMGEVYAAYHPDLDRRIALKVVQGFEGSTGERRTRLLREARAIARLSHPNVVTVHDAGTFGDRVFIAMELIDGQTIDRWLRDEPRTWQEIVDVFIAAGRGLAAAHAAGVVHRDFKPQNVMIAKDGAVRVMDFGLARLDEQEIDERRDGDEESTVSLGPATKTGALVGTPAYMSPEQFRREKIDARADQFSFCVALHEALFGKRPPAAIADESEPAAEAPPASSRGSVPGWLRSAVFRGAAPDREQRYPSMAALIAALERGRTRLRRRVSLVAVGVGVLVLSAGSWRIARGNRFACAVPEQHVAAAWSTNAADTRRQSIHRSFATSGRETAETSWTRVSKVLDNYVTAWNAMYVQACEATHVRGEQSSEVLDLRMACLNDNLDRMRALTDLLAAGDGKALSQAVAAARDLTPVSRCADLALLRSAVPLPRDEQTLREVQRLRRALAEAQMLVDIGDFARALERSKALRPEVEATGYKPLLAELLAVVGTAESSIDEDPSKSDATLREALLVAESSRDDLTAAKAASTLVYVSGYRLGRVEDAKYWARLGHAIIDRLGGAQARLRSWVDGNLGGALVRTRDFAGARILFERSARLKEQSVGREHPDFASSLGNLSYALTKGGNPAEGLIAANRAIEIFINLSDPNAIALGFVYENQGEAFLALSRYAEAEQAFQTTLQNLTKNVGRAHPETAYPLHGLGEVRLARGAPSDAIPFFEEALLTRQQPNADPAMLADTQFGLARSLWDAGRDRRRALRLADSAHQTYATLKLSEPATRVNAWLTTHKLGRR